ncbi:MAG TPA: DUF559 domain-containing protein [bacterium]|nr:DUF559 domain-containing protein [bacterium]
MPKKIKKLTDEWKKNIGKANSIKMKEYWKQGRASKKQISNIDILKNLAKNNKKLYGYVNSPKTRKKISKIWKRKWKEGEVTEKQRATLFKKGHDDKRTKTQFKPGHKHTEKTKKKMRSRWTDKRRQEQRIRSKEIRSKLIFPSKDTSIEVKIQDYLKRLGVDFFTHQYMTEIEHGYQCDIFIPAMDLIIECDGDYWHKYPAGNDIDNIRTKELIEKGFKVLRLWEKEIKAMDLTKFNKILSKAGGKA